MLPEVSVIITSYNTERYIGRAIESALAQEGVTLEVIVVDDASSDNSWQVISGFTDPRVKSLRMEKNGGPSVTRNAGIAMASEGWLAVLDGDDAYAPGRLRKCLDCAAAGKADVVVDNLMVVREADGARFPMFSSEELPAQLNLPRFIAGNQNFLGGWALGYLKPVFSADFLKKHGLGYDPEIRIGEDYLLLAGVLAMGARCAVWPEALYLYTVRAGSISHRLKPEDMERVIACDQKFLSRFGSRLSLEAQQAQRKREAKAREALAFTRLVRGLKQKSVGEVFSALRLSPVAPIHLWPAVRGRLMKLVGGNRS